MEKYTARESAVYAFMTHAYRKYTVGVIQEVYKLILLHGCVFSMTSFVLCHNVFNMAIRQALPDDDAGLGESMEDSAGEGEMMSNGFQRSAKIKCPYVSLQCCPCNLAWLWISL